MKPEEKSQLLLGVTRSKAKMFEYNVPTDHHISIRQDPIKLLTLSIGILGELAARENSENIIEADLADLRKSLQFSARFFDSYLQSQLNKPLDPYLLLLGSASYYLCDLPGSSLVLATNIDRENIELSANGIDHLMTWLLQNDYSQTVSIQESPYKKDIDAIIYSMIEFNGSGLAGSNLITAARNLRQRAYDFGSPRELLFSDIVTAIVRKKYENSSWISLPKYSALEKEKWHNFLTKANAVKELWPAQHLLGEVGVLKGISSIVQMPTSAGKTKSTELVIRSAFISERTDLAVIVAPFRALCHEIHNSLSYSFSGENINVNELTDVLQFDYQIDEFNNQRQILVVTPEKLIYLLKQTPELVEKIGLIIFDEGHQFDSGTRGIKYELLLTSLKIMLKSDSQKILISAVITNADAVNLWLNGENAEIAFGKFLTPTFRTFACASWVDPLGRLLFFDQRNPDIEEFYVPRVIESYELKLRNRERAARMFPMRDDEQAIALELGLKLSKNGSVAVFCGKKDTAAKVCEKIIDAFERELPLSPPSQFSNNSEIERLYNLYSANLGDSAIVTKCAKMGIFTHHGNTPHGIRLAVENAMKLDLIRFVVCTSTLAQGVNLPIRYLIVTSVYQGAERIKVRDFHNLIGRAGRSGMYTEGSIIFADPVLYDTKEEALGNWRWKELKNLLEPNNSEPCASTLLTLFMPFENETKSRHVRMEPMDFVNLYIAGDAEIERYINNIVNSFGEKKYTKQDLQKQVNWKINIISSIESFLLSQWPEESNDQDSLESISELAKNTLAYHLADVSEKKQILEIFAIIANRILNEVADSKKRKIYGKTLLGIREIQEIESWVQLNIETLNNVKDDKLLLQEIWPILVAYIKNNIFVKCSIQPSLLILASDWIEGKSFYEIFDNFLSTGAKLVSGKQLRNYKIEHIVEICENAISYEGSVILGAVAEIIEFLFPEEKAELVERVKILQKRIKYGLSSLSSINVYELGFADRVIANEFSILMKTEKSKNEIKEYINENKDSFERILLKYPIHFSKIFESLSNE
ncbi:DEAD/DEAH box helicase [Leptospira meyeri]|uniref:DEAD/DEAH box helicase n=1 Tax=Leptospira meyeri TaxID=29508 RepID=UPI000C29CAD6|nr:DEAD/DEAH box helicase [Leptospira meyeri]PJZ79274.1 DEAD/DEAH box helicase [Leptospira meyeri]PJZ95108.1 DEAD/DEAH box helicase [Leptospira meyeri]